MAEKEIKATEQTDMDKLTTEMMEHICDEICQHSNNGRLNQDELDDICAECKMGQFVCDILNAYNRLNDFDKTQSYDLLKKLSEYQNLEEQGLLLKLPCKVGDVVYEFVERIGIKGHWEEDKYFVDEWEKNIIREREFNLYMLLFFKLFTASCCTLFTTIFKIISNATSHYSSPIMYIKYCYPKTKHII